MKRLLRALGRILLAVLLLGLLYLLLWPTPVAPAAWTPPPPPALQDVYAPQPLLSQAELLLPDSLPGPEDVVRDSAGNLYTGCVNGIVYRISRDGRQVTRFADTRGRPLGLYLDSLGNLLVCDADRGLLRIAPDGLVTRLSDRAGGRPFGFTNALDVAPDGRIYFTDASAKYSLAELESDLLEHRPHGRLLRYDPASRRTEVLADSLYFANGVALAPDAAFVLVNELSKYRVTRVWLKGPRAGQREVFADNLPGFPDNLARTAAGSYWVGLVSPRSALLDGLLPHPFARRMVARLPQFPRPVPQGMLLRLGPDGDVTGLLTDTTGRLHSVDGARQFGDTLYLTSPYRNGLGRLVLPR